MAELLLTLAPQLPMVVLLTAVGVMIGRWVNSHINKLMVMHQDDKLKHHEERTKSEQASLQALREIQAQTLAQAKESTDVVKENTRAYGGVTSLLGRIESRLDVEKK